MLCLTIRGAASSGFGRTRRFGASAVEIIQLIAIAINCYQLISIYMTRPAVYRCGEKVVDLWGGYLTAGLDRPLGRVYSTISYCPITYYAEAYSTITY